MLINIHELALSDTSKQKKGIKYNKHGVTRTEKKIEGEE